MGQLNSQLFATVEENNIEVATILLDKGANPNTTGGDNNQNVLALACAKGYKELAVLLVSRGASVNVGRFRMDIPLHAAAIKGHEEIVDILVQSDADIHRRDICERTAVHYATMQNHPSVVERLVSYGVNADIDDCDGNTPLWHAAASNYVDCVDVLLSVGANPRRKNKLNKSPLDIAKKTSNSSPLIKKLEDGVISSAAGKQGTGQSNVQPSVISSTLATQSVKSKQHRLSRESASFARSLPLGSAAANSLTSLNSSDDTSFPSQATAVSDTGKHEDIVKQLTDEVEHSRQETETCKRQIDEIMLEKANELEVAADQRRALKREMAEIRSQNEVLQRSITEEQKEKDHVFQEKNVLELALFDLRRQKKEKELRAEELNELLSGAEKANDRTREMLQESEKVLSIPARDIQLTNKKLGSGSYGEVYIAYWKGCPVAVKMLYEELAAYKSYIDILEQEVSISWKIHHPNIAAVCGVTVELEDEKKTAWIVMELLQGSMASVIKETRREGVRPLTLREKIDMTYDSLCGLRYLHTLPRLVLHGDIRPTNILVNTVMKAKLGDLGAARFGDASNTTGMMSPYYTAPERMDGRTARKNKETDIYSLGVSVCELFTGQTPDPPKRMDQIQLIQQENVRDLCDRMVADEPDRRPSAGDGLAAIGSIRATDDYNGCPPRRMVKGKLDGVQHVTLTDQMW